MARKKAIWSIKQKKAAKKTIKVRITPPKKPKLTFPKDVFKSYEIGDHEYIVYVGDWEDAERQSRDSPGQDAQAYPAEDVEVWHGEKLLGTVDYDIFNNIYAAALSYYSPNVSIIRTVKEIDKQVTYDLTQAALDYILSLSDE
jgi:hypothetical protein